MVQSVSDLMEISLEQILIIGAGGFIGAILRYLLSAQVQTYSKNAAFPLGTLGVNLLGAFLIGLLIELANTYGIFSPQLRSFLFIGILGALTTFSTFSLETVELLQEGWGAGALLNIGANVSLCLLAVWLGRMLVTSISK
jgi:fluoride exporter